MKKFNKIYNTIVGYILTNRLFISYVLISIVGTSICRYITIGNTAFLPFITDFGFILLIGSLGYFIQGKNQFKYFFTWIIIYGLAEIVNSFYYLFYTSFASFGDLATLSQTETVMGSIWEKVRIEYLIFVFFPILFYLIHNKLKYSTYYYFVSKVEKSKKMVITTLLCGLIMIVISLSFATKTDYSRLNKQWNRVYIVERFGIIMYEGNDLFQTIRPRLSSLFGQEEAQALFDNYFLNENNQKYKQKNEYTGILEGKNIIFVHMESMQNFLMALSFNGQEVTPNLNKLASEGMFFENFYPQVSTGTSSDTEFTLSSSLMPAASGTVFVSYYDRYYNTLQKILSNNNYYTFSMHGNFSSMWNRSKAHPSLGYQGLYFEESFNYNEDDVINLGINDKLFYNQAIPIIEGIEQEYPNYMGTVITLSNHSPFIYLDKYGEFDLSVEYESCDEKNNCEIKTSNYLEGTSIGNYIHSVHYADEALGEFLNYINNSEAFENTIFVFYGDHDAKLSRKELSYLYNYDIDKERFYNEDDDNYAMYDTFAHELNKKTPLIIWTKNNSLKNIFNKKISYYMGMIDVSPTILNMFGLENKYALGHDIFNIKDENTIVYPNGNFLTNELYYNNSTGSYKVLKENIIINEEFINEHKQYAEKLLEVSNSIIVYNLLEGKVVPNE